MVLGKLPVPGHPINFDFSRARAYYACSRCRLGLFGHFFSRLSLRSSFPPLCGRRSTNRLIKYYLRLRSSPIVLLSLRYEHMLNYI